MHVAGLFNYFPKNVLLSLTLNVCISGLFIKSVLIKKTNFFCCFVHLTELLVYVIADSIEANVEHATIHVEKGNEQLASARNYQVVYHLMVIVLRCYMCCVSIDSIEANIEHTSVHVVEATQQLGKAREYQVQQTVLSLYTCVAIIYFAPTLLAALSLGKT